MKFPSRILFGFALYELSLLPSCASRQPSQLPSSVRRSQGIYHLVQPGENLFRIGKAYDVSVEELARVNGIRDASQIRAGQKIFIPDGARQLPVETITPNSAPRSAPLRDLLNSALSSPSGRCVVTDESGTLLGTATDHDIIDAIRRAKEARSGGGQERSDRGVITA